MKRRVNNLLLSLFVMPGIGQLIQERWALGITFIVIELGLLGWLIYVIVSFFWNMMFVYENLDALSSLREFVRTHPARVLTPLILIIINRLTSGIEALVRTKA